MIFYCLIDGDIPPSPSDTDYDFLDDINTYKDVYRLNVSMYQIFHQNTIQYNLYYIYILLKLNLFNFFFFFPPMKYFPFTFQPFLRKFACSYKAAPWCMG